MTARGDFKLCAMLNLAGAIIGKDPNILKGKFGLPPKIKPLICPRCGNRKNKETTTLCVTCYKASKRIEVACSCGCGETFKRKAQYIIFYTSAKGYQHFFKDRKHLGHYIGVTYGFKKKAPSQCGTEIIPPPD